MDLVKFEYTCTLHLPYVHIYNVFITYHKLRSDGIKIFIAENRLE